MPRIFAENPDHVVRESVGSLNTFVIKGSKLYDIGLAARRYVLSFQQNLKGYEISLAMTPGSGLGDLIGKLVGAGFSAASLRQLEAWQITARWLQSVSGWSGSYEFHLIPKAAEEDWPSVGSYLETIGRHYALGQDNPRKTIIAKVKKRL